jgi:hypothetical protein
MDAGREALTMHLIQDKVTTMNCFVHRDVHREEKDKVGLAWPKEE